MGKAFKRAFILVLLAAFAAIAVFGAFDSLASAESGMQGCLANSLNGFACPEAPGTLNFLSFHVKAFTDFSSGALGVASVLALAALFAAAFLHLSSHVSTPRPVAVSWQRLRESFASSPGQASVRWLSLLENSPSAR